MPKWACVIVEVASSLAGDPSTSCHTWSHIPSSSLLSHANCGDHQKFAVAIGNTKWDSAMKEECSYLKKNHTWDLCSLPKGRKLVQCKWLYHTKFVVDSYIDN